MTFDEGKELLARLKEVSFHTDSYGRYTTNSTCYSIEHLLEQLNEKRRRLEELWRNRKHKLEQCIQICFLKDEIKKVNHYFNSPFKNVIIWKKCFLFLMQDSQLDTK